MVRNLEQHFEFGHKKGIRKWLIRGEIGDEIIS